MFKCVSIYCNMKKWLYQLAISFMMIQDIMQDLLSLIFQEMRHSKILKNLMNLQTKKININLLNKSFQIASKEFNQFKIG